MFKLYNENTEDILKRWAGADGKRLQMLRLVCLLLVLVATGFTLTRNTFMPNVLDRPTKSALLLLFIVVTILGCWGVYEALRVRLGPTYAAVVAIVVFTVAVVIFTSSGEEVIQDEFVKLQTFAQPVPVSKTSSLGALVVKTEAVPAAEQRKTAMKADTGYKDIVPTIARLKSKITSTKLDSEDQLGSQDIAELERLMSELEVANGILANKVAEFDAKVYTGSPVLHEPTTATFSHKGIEVKDGKRVYYRLKVVLTRDAESRLSKALSVDKSTDKRNWSTVSKQQFKMLGQGWIISSSEPDGWDILDTGVTRWASQNSTGHALEILSSVDLSKASETPGFIEYVVTKGKSLTEAVGEKTTARVSVKVGQGKTEGFTSYQDIVDNQFV